MATKTDVIVIVACIHHERGCRRRLGRSGRFLLAGRPLGFTMPLSSSRMRGTSCTWRHAPVAAPVTYRSGRCMMRSLACLAAHSSQARRRPFPSTAGFPEAALRPLVEGLPADSVRTMVLAQGLRGADLEPVFTHAKWVAMQTVEWTEKSRPDLARLLADVMRKGAGTSAGKGGPA